MNDYEPEAQAVLRDRSASRWLKAALRVALERDPVDATADAERLAAVLEERLDRIYGVLARREEA